MRRTAPLCLLILLTTSPLLAWSNKEHIQLTRMAAARLIAHPQTPEAMKQWLKQACPGLLSLQQEQEYFLKQRVGLIPRGVEGLPYWAVVPDMIAMSSGSGEREKKVEPFGVGERVLHYVDLEYFNPAEARRKYRHDLSNRPRIDDIPLVMTDPRWQSAGMLPFRVEHCYQQLVKAIRSGTLVDKPGQFPRDEHATKWAGYLAHYVEDNTQPQHATEDYKSRSYFADGRRAPNIHWDMEGRLMDDENNDYMELRKEFWAAFIRAADELIDPIDTLDLKRATLEVSLASYEALPLVGLAAMKAYAQGGTPEKPDGPIGKFDPDAFFRFKGTFQGREMTLLEMKARQMAWGMKRVETLWLRAWNEGQVPAPREPNHGQ